MLSYIRRSALSLVIKFRCFKYLDFLFVKKRIDHVHTQVADAWWCEPGHGDLCTCLEKYTLCRDGLYHKVNLHYLS